MKFIKSKLDTAALDEELVATYKRTSDIKILGELYGRYMDLVYGVCLKYYQDEEVSKDSVMLIFEELISKLQKYEVTNFKSWLYQLAKNHCLMQLRKEKSLKKSNTDVHLMQIEESVHLNGVLEKEEQLNQLQNCIEHLPDEQKRTVELFYLHGKCYREITSETGLEWNKVRSSIQNGRRNLKICMEKQNTATTY